MKRRPSGFEPRNIPAYPSPFNLDEAAVIRGVRNHLKAYGWFVVRMQQGLGSHPGVADLYAIKDGRDIWIETKSQRGGTQSPDQVEFQHDIEAHGGEYFIVQSVDQLKAIVSGSNSSAKGGVVPTGESIIGKSCLLSQQTDADLQARILSDRHINLCKF